MQCQKDCGDFILQKSISIQKRKKWKIFKKNLIVQVFFDRIQKQKNGNSGLISRIFLIKTVCIDFGKKYGF